MYATTAARILLAKSWTSNKIPTKSDWLAKMIKYQHLTELTGRIRGNSVQKVNNEWSIFKEYLKNYYG